MSTLPVQHVGQYGKTHCAAACLEMVYRYFGITNITQHDIWRKRKTTRLDGSRHVINTEDIAKELAENGFQVLMGQFYLDIDRCRQNIKNLLAEENPIIACKQWRPGSEYGHSVVIIGIEKDQIAFIDPEKDSETQYQNLESFINEWQPTGKEVVGGEFIVMGKNKKPLQIKKLHLTNFWVPNEIKSFCLDGVDF